MHKKLSVYCVSLTPLRPLHYVWCNTIINAGGIVCVVRTGRTNNVVSEFNKIPMSMVKKEKKDYTDFINKGIVLKIMTSPGKVIKVAATLMTTILSQGCRSLSTWTPQSP